MNTAINLGNIIITITLNNQQQPSAYVNDSQEASATGAEAILASYLDEARSAGVEDELYSAIEA